MKKIIALLFLSAFVGMSSAPTFAAVSNGEILVIENGGDDKKKKKDKEKGDCEPKECNKVSTEKSGGCCQKAPEKKSDDSGKKK